MAELIETILKNAGTGTNTIFLALFLLILWMLRQDSKDHKEEYQEVIREMFTVVNKNTESNTKLSESIGDLKDRLK